MFDDSEMERTKKGIVYPSHHNCGYLAFWYLNHHLFNADVTLLILRTVHSLLLAVLDQNIKRYLPDKVRNPSYVTKTVDIFLKFVVSGEMTLDINIRKLNKFQRKIIHTLCNQVPEMGVKCRYDTKTQRQGGSHTKCDCRRPSHQKSDSEEYYNSYDEPNYSVCEDHGYVRNFIVGELQLRRLAS